MKYASVFVLYGARSTFYGLLPCDVELQFINIALGMSKIELVQYRAQ